MGSNGENVHAKTTRLMVELVKGKEFATQLQNLLHKPVEEHGPLLAEELALQILRSFTETLSVLSSCTGSSAQISAVDGGGSGGGSACSGETKKKVKDRRGCYKRRRTSDTWERVSSTMEDGRTWRKYGQKDILNSEYPRCYFRCTHKPEGCKATKQVQRMKGNPILYRTTYFNHHTCKQAQSYLPHLIIHSDPPEPNLISFQDNNNNNNIPSKQDDRNSQKPAINISPVVKQEDTQSDIQDLSDAKPTLPWQEIIGPETIGYKPEWAPMRSSYQEEVVSGFHSCESTSLHGLDMEVNQLGDIDNLHYFDDKMY
ncbi:hypothetical protein CDL12_02441 [Handroanthus impetiginosus]|uniref:WRKY domain-containing protein n=1 Tax=Handroanthus impetiginosus TaxID=429701 RepID=A0A2G9I4Y9_9LAMI|nr:hypothetical protein CDL12_02441 [Handroanthus impetiginosus]